MNEVIKRVSAVAGGEESDSDVEENLPTTSFRGSVATVTDLEFKWALFLTEQDLSVPQIYALWVLLCVNWIATGFSKYLQYANTISGNM